jgi:ubiquinone/menaquinone biosynthesis C-methylase UbiE
MPDMPPHPIILDIGCGSGAQTMELARLTSGKITALDNHQPFLDKLMDQARSEGVAGRITTLNKSMLAMEFEQNTFDLIWSEGALYFMGFRNGLEKCRQLLKTKGYLAVTEAVYLESHPPETVVQFWEKEYTDIKDIATKIEVIAQVGFQLISHFTLPKTAWLNNFYLPMEIELKHLRKKYQTNETALKVFKTAQQEIDFYLQYSDYYGYEFFVMQK